MNELTLQDFSLIPKGYKNKDPRCLLYLYSKTINVVAYAKKLQQFSFYQTLEVAEDLAKRQGFILLPWECIHWQRAQSLGAERKIKIGRNSFYLLRISELTKTERVKLENYLVELNEHEEIAN